jgi:murein DD-endopeptidase MepM/ murein hydrolase activator NlpD
MGQLHGGTERAALGMKLFGRGWQTIVPLMNDGNKGMREQLALADKYGVTLNGKTVKSVKELIIAQREAKFASMGLQVTLGTTLVPTLTKVVTAANHFVLGMRDGTGEGGRLAKTAKDIAHDLEPAAKWLVNTGKSVAEFVGHHRALEDTAAAILAVSVAIKALKFGGAITGLTSFVKIATASAKKLPPIFAAEGAAAGTAAGEGAAASAAATSPKILAAGRALGTKFGTAFKLAAGVGIASAIAQALNAENADPLLFLHPPKAGLTPDQEHQALKDAVKQGLAGVGPSGRIYLPGAENLTKLPHLTRRPQGAKAATGGQGKLIGAPYQGTHAKAFNVAGGSDNWQSENAVDIAVKVGTPILAVEAARSPRSTSRAAAAGSPARTVTINGDSGNSYFYAHLSAVIVKAGQHVGAGEVIGASGSANGVAHLHFATEKGDPRTLKLPGGGFAVNALTAGAADDLRRRQEVRHRPGDPLGRLRPGVALRQERGPVAGRCARPVPAHARHRRRARRHRPHRLPAGRVRRREVPGALQGPRHRRHARRLQRRAQRQPQQPRDQGLHPRGARLAKQWGTVQDGQRHRLTQPTGGRRAADRRRAHPADRPAPAQQPDAGLGAIGARTVS